MRVPASETVVVKPELIRLVRRDDSKKWQAHYKLENLKTWFRRSTDTANVKEASKIAERMWMKATFDFEEGRPITSKKFKPVAEIVLHRLEAAIAAGTAKPSARDYVSAIKLYLVPFYALYNVDGIKPSVIVEWHPKLSHIEENLHPNLSHPNRLSCLIFEQGWARSDQRGNFEQITQTCPSRQGLHPTS